MAIDGTYNVVVDTPIGKQNNVMTLKTDGDVLSGTMKSLAFNAEDNFTGGKVNGDAFEFEFEAATPMGKMKLEVKGTVSGDKTSGEVKTMFGMAPFEGTRA